MKIYKKTLSLVGLIFLSSWISGQVKRYSPANRFKKLIEPAMILPGAPNIEGKTALQSKFFPDYNGNMEFFVEPSFKGASGFRVDSLDGNYFLDVKWIPNRKEVYVKVQKEFPIKLTYKEESDTISKEESDRRENYNKAQISKIHQKAFDEFEISSRKIQISRNLVEKLYDTTISIIQDYAIKGIPAMSFDGYSVNYRCIVGDEVWNFFIINPFGIFSELTNICNQIVTEVKENRGKIEEEKYIKLLNALVE